MREELGIVEIAEGQMDIDRDAEVIGRALQGLQKEGKKEELSQVDDF